MGWKNFLRITEGNKQLAVSIDAFLKRRDKLTANEWRKNIKPIMAQAQNEINQFLRTMSLTEFQLFNLKRIRANIQEVVNSFEARFNVAIKSGMSDLADFTTDSAGMRAGLVGLTAPSTFVLGEEIITSIIPLTDQFTRFFANDMANIIGTEISLGLAGQQSTVQVAANINAKFDSSRMSFARADRIARTEMLTASSLAEDTRHEEIGETNPDARRIWINSHKPAARRNHIKVETNTRNKPIRIGQLFTIPGDVKLKVPTEKAKFPRDPRLSAANRVFCNCTVAIINKRDLIDLPNIGIRRAA